MRTRSCFVFLVVALALPLLGTTAHAQTADCDALPAERKAVVRELFAALHPYDGCDETFARCLAVKSPKPVVLRLASAICRQVKAGDERKQVERKLASRAQTMLATGPRATIVLDEAARAGRADAPVTAVVYACARCPFCKMMVPALHKAVTEGPLAGKVRLYLRPFPLKTHPLSTEGGLGLVSAAKLGRTWPFALQMYEHFDAFCPDVLPTWAEAAGMDRAAFAREYADPKNRETLVAAKQEGLRNKVNATPTLFIDGRPYLHELTVDAVLDVLAEAYEAKTAGGK